MYICNQVKMVTSRMSGELHFIVEIIAGIIPVPREDVLVWDINVFGGEERHDDERYRKGNHDTVKAAKAVLVATVDSDTEETRNGEDTRW